MPRSSLSVLLIAVLLPVAASAQTLGDDWSLSDVGAPVIQGYATHSNEIYTVSGGGAGIGGNADQFTFVHRELTGDGKIIARVAGLQNASSSAKAGVMIRETARTGSRNAFLFVTPSSGIAFQRRVSAGGKTAATAAAGAAPIWLKVERRASTITASWSPDGAAWTTVGSAVVSMAGVVDVGLAVTSGTEVSAATATFSNVSVVPLVEYGGVLPAGWSSVDIGGPRQPGTAKYDAGTFGVLGGGRDIAGTWDQFHFAYTRAEGDLDIVARVQALGDTNIWSKAGVMIRESLAPDAAHASMFVTALRGTAFQRRPLPGGTSVSTAGNKARAPVWLKLSLRDGVATSYQSKDGKSWTVVGTQTLNLPSSFYVGLAVTSRDDTATVTANFSDVRIERSANQAPVVSLVTPVDGAVYTAPAAVTISAEASDSDGTIAWVDFYQGATLIGSDTTSPYTMTWSNVGAGTYEVTAVATDDKGASTRSRAHTIVVNTAPRSRAVVFNASAEHDTLVKSYLVEIFAAGANPEVDLPVASQNVGKPMVVNGECTADVTAMIDALAPGNYQVTVAAVGDYGMARSAPPVAITR